ncbi:LPD7 domain-containing protein [Vibrio mediterranei]|uniref:LPD7 domain-containing protein n=1 Tax=Vibrio mediterranei TaxID=689 RepID=UPI0038CDE3CD
MSLLAGKLKKQAKKASKATEQHDLIDEERPDTPPVVNTASSPALDSTELEHAVEKTIEKQNNKMEEKSPEYQFGTWGDWSISQTFTQLSKLLNSYKDDSKAEQIENILKDIELGAERLDQLIEEAVKQDWKDMTFKSEMLKKWKHLSVALNEPDNIVLNKTADSIDSFVSKCAAHNISKHQTTDEKAPPEATEKDSAEIKPKESPAAKPVNNILVNRYLEMAQKLENRLTTCRDEDKPKFLEGARKLCNSVKEDLPTETWTPQLSATFEQLNDRINEAPQASDDVKCDGVGLLRPQSETYSQASQQITQTGGFVEKQQFQEHNLSNKHRVGTISNAILLSSPFHPPKQRTGFVEHDNFRGQSFVRYERHNGSDFRDYGNMLLFEGNKHDVNAKNAVASADALGWGSIAVWGNRNYIEKVEQHAAKKGIQVVEVDTELNFKDMTKAITSTKATQIESSEQKANPEQSSLTTLLANSR